jgi:hypothetical protein
MTALVTTLALVGALALVFAGLGLLEHLSTHIWPPRENDL